MKSEEAFKAPLQVLSGTSCAKIELVPERVGDLLAAADAQSGRPGIAPSSNNEHRNSWQCGIGLSQTNSEWDFWTSLQVVDGALVATTWSCYLKTLDAATGRTLSSVFTK